VEQLKSVGSATPHETEYLRKDGSCLPAMLGLVLMEGTNTIVGFVLDRTEQKVAQERLQKYAVDLEAANRELETFTYSVAHDLKAPLRSIDGFSQILLKSYHDKLDEDGREHLRFLRESAQHMGQLIDGLLALSRVTRSEMHSEEVDLSALAHAAVARLRTSQPDRPVDVVILEGLEDRGDPRLLTAMLDNLLANAWKFTGRRDAARIEFGVRSTDGDRVYLVRDNGAGFDMAFASRLFGVFQRLHAASDFEGTGVGLATVRRIVSRHGGRLWAEGEVDVGATFYFTLNDKACAA
jgi:light-regulated signal transduction histidine kinase (bacteriophytochrome)